MGHGVGYVHLKGLGAPPEVRRPYRATGDVRRFRAAYRAHLDGQRAAIDQLESLAHGRRTAMMCLEANVALCHRGVLAEYLRADGLEVVEIEIAGDGPASPGTPVKAAGRRRRRV